jgi:Peptidase C10 family/Secretion system C-terminal sorting domain
MKYKYLLIFIFFVKIHFIKAQVTPLTTTNWNQGCFYNESAPSMVGGQCGRAYSGCYATALAQIFKFNNFPATSWGGNYTNSGTPIQTVNYDAQIFNWTMMPNSISVSNPQVANLMYVCGVSNNMLYSTTSSDSYFDILPFVKFFKYSLSTKASAKFLFATNADWINEIKNELNNGRIVFAKGGNHFYLIDGYNTLNLFHINFGFGGLYDGYYDILNVVAGSVNYTPINIIIGIKPLQNIDFLSSNDTNSFSVSSTGGIASYKLSSLTNWTITSDQIWCVPTLTSSIAGYYGSLSANVSTNPTGNSRTATLTATDGTNTVLISVIQALNPLSIIENNIVLNNITLYPNPVIDSFYLNTNLESYNEFKGILFDISGKLIKAFEIQNQITKIDVSKFQNGVYFVEILNNLNQIKRFKILKK